MSCGVRAAWLYCRKYPFATLLLAGDPQQPESIPMEMSWRRQVLNRVIRTVFIIGAACQFAQLPVLAQDAAKKEKKVKDQGEYDIYTAANKEADPTKQLQILQTWKEKYRSEERRVGKECR